MLTVAQAKDRLGKLYHRKSATWSVAPFPSTEAVILGLQPPNDRQAAADMAGVARWIQLWSRVQGQDLHVDWELRRWPNTGTQMVPVRLSVSSPQAMARFLGCSTHWTQRRERAQRLMRLAGEDSPEFGQVVAKILPKLDNLPEADFERIFDVLAWLAEHPHSGLYPRQLPVSGIDSKWLERHASIVRPLHVASGGESDLGLVTPPKMYRAKFLDPALAPGGLTDLSAPLSVLAALSAPVQYVLIVENLQTLLSLPDMEGVIALHGAGYDVRWCAQLPWVRRSQVVYWGDLDTDGLTILAALRGVLPQSRSVMTDSETLQQFIDFAVPDPNGLGKQAPQGLSDSERELFELLGELGGLRLEQERITWSHALNELFWVLSAP